MMADQGPPRKTTTYKQFDGMNSQDERYGAEKNELFWMENMMRVGDGKIRSIPGPSAAALQIFPVEDLLHFLLLEDATGPGYLILEEFGKIDLRG